MTRIDFYILDHGGAAAALLYCCRLVEKAWQKGHRVFVLCDSAEQSAALDALLWSFRPDAFVPHACDIIDTSAISIGREEHCGEHSDVLVNLGREVPSTFSRFRRMAEIACQDAEWLDASRRRFNWYQHRGYPLHHHRIAG